MRSSAARNSQGKPPSRLPFRKGKYRTLDDPGEIHTVVDRQVETPHPFLGAAMLFCVFFRPEEHRASSERVDDAGLVQLGYVHQGNEYPQTSILIGDPVSQVAVDVYTQGLSGLRAPGPDHKRKRFSCQLPLHEGQRYRVYRSGRVYLLSRAERDVVSHRLGGHRVGPGDLSPLVPEEKDHLLLQFLYDVLHPAQGKPQLPGDIFRG